jgi:hypothetical protein
MKNKLENDKAVETKFDQISKIFAEGLTRRQSLRRIGGGLAGVIVGSLVGRVGAAIDRNDPCAHWCDDNFPPGPARGDCKSQAAHFMGPCYQCGPAAPPGHGPFCGQVCCAPGEVCSPDNVCLAATGTTFVICDCADGTEIVNCTNVNCNQIGEFQAFCSSVCALNGGFIGGNCQAHGCPG